MGPIREELSNRKEKAHQKLRDVLSPLPHLFMFQRNQERWESPCSCSQLVHCQPFELVQGYWGLRPKSKAQNCSIFPGGCPTQPAAFQGSCVGLHQPEFVHVCVLVCTGIFHSPEQLRGRKASDCQMVAAGSLVCPCPTPINCGS